MEKTVNRKIKGVNLGGWLLMEGYILGGDNIGESLFKKEFKRINGKQELERFEQLFRDNFITEADFKKISLMQATVVRIPFHYRLIEKKPYSYSEKGLKYLDRVLFWAEKYNLKVIIDLHAAAGSQNCDWHADSLGRALFWENKDYRSRTVCMWEMLADRFKDKHALCGYDLLNEPVLGKRSAKLLYSFYQKLIKKIRAIDKDHFIFIEGDNWAQNIQGLEDLIEDNVQISIHNYIPLDYVFNFIPFSKFPGKSEGVFWDKGKIYKHLESYYKFSLKHKVNIFVGEFGINWRGGFWGESEWLKSVLSIYDDFKFNYTYWTYKSVANSIFPDGVYQYLANGEIINRQGPMRGWGNYPIFWKQASNKIIKLLKTDNFVINGKVASLLKESFQK